MAFTGFINEFSNSPIQPTYQSYLPLDFTSVTSVQLEWPFVNPNTLTPYAQVIKVTVNTSATNKIIMPDATQATQGQTNTIVNAGASTILVYAFDGVTPIETIATTQQYLITLTDNTTSNGVWLPIQLGATTSAATAAELIDNTTDTNTHSNAGGLGAFSTNWIKQNLIINKVTVGSTYTQASGDRGMILVWESGTGVYTCLPASTFGNGYAFTIVNNSTVGGQLTIAMANGSNDTINGQTVPFVLSPGNSSSFSSDGVHTFYSFASSQSQTSVVTLTPVDLTTAISDSITLSSTQASYSIQKFVNSPSSSPITIMYPNNIINEWIAYNASTTNPVLVTLVNGGFSYLIAPGNRLSLFSDGTNLYNTPNFLDNTIIYLADGTVIAPSLTFSSDPTTGLFIQTADQITELGITVNGTSTMNFDSTQNTSVVALSVPNGTTSEPSIFFQGSVTTGTHLTTSGTYSGSYTIGNNNYDAFYFSSVGNTAVLATGVGAALNTLNGSYHDQGVSIYSIMRAYG